MAALQPQGKWQESTVKTLLNRLLKKRAVSARKDGCVYAGPTRKAQSLLPSRSRK
jgi:predicted transcriptional regulator